MKLFFICALTALAFISCKKDRTCTCETTTVSSSTMNGGVGNVDPGPFGKTVDVNMMPKVTKKQARANCISGNNTSTYTDAYGDTKTETTRKDCVLK